MRLEGLELVRSHGVALKVPFILHRQYIFVRLGELDEDVARVAFHHMIRTPHAHGWEVCSIEHCALLWARVFEKLVEPSHGIGGVIRSGGKLEHSNAGSAFVCVCVDVEPVVYAFSHGRDRSAVIGVRRAVALVVH